MVEIVEVYNEVGVDEIVFLDIMVIYEGRKMIIDVVEKIVVKVFIFFMVGGGILSVKDMYNLLRVGVDKVLINLVVVWNLKLIEEGVEYFGL